MEDDESDDEGDDDERDAIEDDIQELSKTESQRFSMLEKAVIILRFYNLLGICDSSCDYDSSKYKKILCIVFRFQFC